MEFYRFVEDKVSFEKQPRGRFKREREVFAYREDGRAYFFKILKKKISRKWQNGLIGDSRAYYLYLKRGN